MPVWLLKLLPYGVASLALGGAVWYIDHQGYKRAQSYYDLAQAREDLRARTEQLAMERKVNDLGNQLKAIVSQHDEALLGRLTNIDSVEKTIIQPTLTKEIYRDPRFTNPDLGISDGMRLELNRARSLSWPDGTCVADSLRSATCKLPAPSSPNR
jgi:hypothetical protein